MGVSYFWRYGDPEVRGVGKIWNGPQTDGVVVGT